MEITFASEKLRKAFNDGKELNRQYGQQMADIIKRRMLDIQAAPTLEAMYAIPTLACHELSNNRAGQLAVKLKQPYRLVFEPANDPPPLKEDRGLDRKRVTAIRILEIVNYH